MCSVNFKRKNKPDSLTFVVSKVRRPQNNERLDIDLRAFTIRDMTDLKDKVLHIIREALAASDILSSI